MTNLCGAKSLSKALFYIIPILNEYMPEHSGSPRDQTLSINYGALMLYATGIKKQKKMEKENGNFKN